MQVLLPKWLQFVSFRFHHYRTISVILGSLLHIFTFVYVHVLPTICVCTCFTHHLCMCMFHSTFVYVHVSLNICVRTCFTQHLCMCMFHSTFVKRIKSIKRRVLCSTKLMSIIIYVLASPDANLSVA